jgi:hypothetical protein
LVCFEIVAHDTLDLDIATSGSGLAVIAVF